MWGVLATVGIVAIGLLVFMSSGSAKISIKPFSKAIDTQIKIDVSDSFTASDPLFRKLPGQLLTITKKVTLDFTATGEKEVAQKSRATITVYNNYGTTPQTLIATTRFASPTGLIFRTLKTVTVPGLQVVNGKATPGSITVEIIADKPGKDYNIAPGRFTIPAFKEKGDMDRYEKFSGETTAAATGGASGLAKVVTEADFSKAKDAITTQAKKVVTETLNTQSAGLKITNPDAITIQDIQSSAQTDEAADTFTMTATGVFKTIAFRESDLQSLIGQYIDQTQHVMYIPEKVTTTYPTSTFVEAQNILTLTVALKGSVYAKVDRTKIVSDLMGRSENGIREYLKTAPGVSSAKVTLSPPWVSSMPKDPNKITFSLEY